MIIEPRFTFKKEEKLKSRKLVEALFKQGMSFSNSPFTVLYIFPGKSIAPLQTGFAVSTKNFKKAVDRNRIKRLMREAFRLHKNGLRENLQKHGKNMALFFIYTGREIPSYTNVTGKIGSALKKLNKIIDEAVAANS